MNWKNGVAIGASAVASWMFLTKPRTFKKPSMHAFMDYDYAHRGLHDMDGEGIPENSIPAFEAAIAHGYGIETDVHLLRDGNLAVFHDGDLKRMCGVHKAVETLDKEQLSRYRLRGSKAHIPLLGEVLALVRGRVPLIIEVKTADDNGAALMERMAGQLDRYAGDFTIQSFDPRVLLWCRRHRSGWVRGQLSECFRANGRKDMSMLADFVSRNMLANAAARPDYIAYSCRNRHALTLRMCVRVFGAPEVNWTIRDQQTYEAVKKDGALAIFEGFRPKRIQK